ncbi:hypothetical protein V6N13_106023 [Hibiscus sabdariffa]
MMIIDRCMKAYCKECEQYLKCSSEAFGESCLKFNVVELTASVIRNMLFRNSTHCTRINKSNKTHISTKNRISNEYPDEYAEEPTFIALSRLMFSTKMERAFVRSIRELKLLGPDPETPCQPSKGKGKSAKRLGTRNTQLMTNIRTYLFLRRLLASVRTSIPLKDINSLISCGGSQLHHEKLSLPEKSENRR